MASRPGNLPSIGVRAMATASARWILSTHSRSTLKMQGFEPSIHLEFANGFFQKGYQLRSFFLRAFLPSSRWPRDTVNMQSIELVAILVGLSDFQTFSWCPCEHPRSLQEGEKVPCTLLRVRARPPNRTTAYLQWILWRRGLLHHDMESFEPSHGTP